MSVLSYDRFTKRVWDRTIVPSGSLGTMVPSYTAANWREHDIKDIHQAIDGVVDSA